MTLIDPVTLRYSGIIQNVNKFFSSVKNKLDIGLSAVGK